EEFERRLAKLRGESDQAALPTGQLIRADYTAELAKDQALHGQLEWEFQHRGNERAIVILKDCQLPLGDFRWAETSGNPAAGDAQLAIVGNDQQGRLAAVVDRTGIMRGEWTLRGELDTEGVLGFHLRLPACPINVLRLTLPDGFAPAADGGSVTLES